MYSGESHDKHYQSITVQALRDALVSCDPHAEVLVFGHSSITYNWPVTDVFTREQIDHLTNQVHHQVWIGCPGTMEDRHRRALGLPSKATRLVGD